MAENLARLRADAEEIFRAGLDVAEPRRAVEKHLERGARGPVVAGRELESRVLRVVAFGKAACGMAKAAARVLSEGGFEAGIAVTNEENRREVPGFRVHTGGHPIPDARGVEAAEDVLRTVAPAREGDALLVLISGGGSAILPAPASGISLDDKIETTEALLACGADIGEINTVRKHLSRLKGGGLAARAAPARVHSLILSDVIGDDLSTIASGPTAPDPTTFTEALGVLRKYEVLEKVREAVRARLERGARGEEPETPKPGDPIFDRVTNTIIGSNGLSLDQAVVRARELGYETVVASRSLTGEAREAAVRLARAARKHGSGGRLAILAGGETTVTLRGDGKGGRNQEMALSFALAAEAMRFSFPWVFLSGGTDGRDGPTDAAGAIADPGTLARGRKAGKDPRAELDDNNSYAFLEASGDLFITGPTGTNVADLQVLLAG